MCWKEEKTFHMQLKKFELENLKMNQNVFCLVYKTCLICKNKIHSGCNQQANSPVQC